MFRKEVTNFSKALYTTSILYRFKYNVQNNTNNLIIFPAITIVTMTKRKRRKGEEEEGT